MMRFMPTIWGGIGVAGEERASGTKFDSYTLLIIHYPYTSKTSYIKCGINKIY